MWPNRTLETFLKEWLMKNFAFFVKCKILVITRKHTDLRSPVQYLPSKYCLFKVNGRNTRKTCEIC